METTRKMTAKRPYVKPVVVAVHLTPEEAVLGNCKTASATGPNQLGCLDGVGGSCATDGS